MYALVRTSPLALVLGPWETVPATIEADGVRVHAAGLGYANGNLLLVDVVYANQPPTEYHTLASTNYGLVGSVLTVTRTWNPPTLAAAKIILKGRLDTEATQRWLNCRGTKNIEAAYTSAASAIDGAGTLGAAITAYQGVVWP
jgi:hypothetical protein